MKIIIFQWVMNNSDKVSPLILTGCVDSFDKKKSGKIGKNV
jgi:hypothetical protein